MYTKDVDSDSRKLKSKIIFLRYLPRSLLPSEKCDQLTQATLYNREAKGIRAAEKKDEEDDGIEERQRRRIEKVGKAIVGETSAGGKGALPSTRRGGERHPGSHSKQTR